MSNAIYKKDLHDVALAVAQGSKDYTDNSIEKLKWELGTYDLSITTDSTVEYTKTIPTNAIKGRLNYIGGMSRVSENKYTVNPQPTINLVAGSNKWFGLGDIPIVNGKTYTIKFFNTRVANEVVQLENYSYATMNYSTPYTFTANTDYVRIRIGHGELTGDINYQLKMMIVEGSTAPTEFKEGFENIRSAKTTSVVISGTDVAPITKVIPTEIINNEYYGLGLDDTHFNKLDLINKKIDCDYKQLTFTGQSSEGWFKSTAVNNRFVINDFWNTYGVDYSSCVNSWQYDYYTSFNSNDNVICRNSGQLIVNVDQEMTLEQFLTKLSNTPLIMIFPLATPIETDISQYIDDDFKNIDTTNMTTATFENEFGYDVPSEIDYLIEEVKA